MAAHASRGVALPAPWVATAALLFGAVAGVALAVQPPLGIGIVVSLCYAVLALLNLPVAIALWLPLIFLEALPAFNLAGKAGGLVLAVAWFGTLGNSGRAAIVATLAARHRRLLEVLVLLLVWLSLSLLWAESPAQVLDDLWHWFAVALLWIVLATTLDTPRALRLAAGAFVAGALVSVLLGVVTGGLEPAAGGRLQGAGGFDSNFLAAALVAAIVLAAALAGTATRPLARGACVAAIPLLAAGLVASQSRGGAVTAVCTVLVALVVFRGRRAYVAAFALLAIGMAIIWFSLSPTAWERVTTFDDGSGRSDIWTVAWRVVEDHPFAGVGLNNFVVIAGDYVREPGELTRVRLIAEVPHFVHNLYLQVLAESGIVGLLLYASFILGTLRAAWQAAQEFAAHANPAMETLARAVLVATISILISGFFLSSMVDKRMWVLFGLGPALLAVASRPAPSRVARSPRQSPAAEPMARR
jgi:O-antigen ligase